jgi:hypothetical protein
MVRAAGAPKAYATMADASLRDKLRQPLQLVPTGYRSSQCNVGDYSGDDNLNFSQRRDLSPHLRIELSFDAFSVNLDDQRKSHT